VASLPAFSERDRVVVAGSLVLSWLAMTVHDLVELPGLVPANPQYTIPTAIWGATAVAWLIHPNRLTTGLLFGWLLLGLVGMTATVLPVKIFGFFPEQSLRHYLLHLVSGLAVVPALVVLWPRTRGALKHTG
jgi:hypothetical protein